MKAHKTILLPCNTPFSSLSIRIQDFIRRMQALHQDVSIISRWQVFDSQIHQWGLKMYWLIKQSTFLEVPSPCGNQIIIAIPTPWLSNGIFQGTKGFWHIPPTNPRSDSSSLWASEIMKILVLLFPFCRGRNSSSQLRSWETYMNEVYGRQRKDM